MCYYNLILKMRVLQCLFLVVIVESKWFMQDDNKELLNSCIEVRVTRSQGPMPTLNPTPVCTHVLLSPGLCHHCRARAHCGCLLVFTCAFPASSVWWEQLYGMKTLS